MEANLQEQLSDFITNYDFYNGSIRMQISKPKKVV